MPMKRKQDIETEGHEADKDKNVQVEEENKLWDSSISPELLRLHISVFEDIYGSISPTLHQCQLIWYH